MSNIHGLGDYRDEERGVPRGNARRREMGGNQYGQPAEQEYVASGIPLTFDSGNAVPKISERLMPRFKLRTFTWFISLVDIIMMLATFIVGQVLFKAAFVRGNDMAGPGTDTLQYMGGKSTTLIRKGEIWRLVTPIVLHAGLLHIVMNLIFQLHFGFTFELRWGTPRFIGVYLMTGIGASLMSAVVNASAVSVGASGALFGLLGADFTYLIMNWEDIPGHKMEMCTIVFVVIINFLMSSVPSAAGGDNAVDWAAHLGGLITGIFFAFFATPVIAPGPKHSMYQWIGVFLYCGFTGLLVLLLALNVVRY